MFINSNTIPKFIILNGSSSIILGSLKGEVVFLKLLNNSRTAKRKHPLFVA